MSDRERAQELRPSNPMLAGILDIADDAIISVNEGQRIVLFNGGAERLFGYTAAEAIGQPLDLLLPPRFTESHRRHIAEFARSDAKSRRMGERSEVAARRKDGTEFPAEASISKLALDGEMILTAMLRDITDRKRAEAEILRLNEDLEARVRERTAELVAANRGQERVLEELRAKNEEVRAMTQQLWQSAKLASVGELAASIAHELNNPLATVTLRIESVLAQTPTDDRKRRVLEIIQQETKRMGDLVANLLQFSRRGTEAVSTVEIRDELLKALDLVQHHFRQRTIKVVQEFAVDLPAIFADRQKLRQVFLNLLTNACDAMPRGGTLTLRAAPATMEKGKLALRIEFEDTGAGIPPAILEKVMEPFFTTKEEGKGTGLGLAICRRVVQEHRGTIVITSNVGKGTTVSIHLPYKDDVNVNRLRGATSS
jgi:two-component system, LuxR family, sensor kinase FixL